MVEVRHRISARLAAVPRAVIDAAPANLQPPATGLWTVVIAEDDPGWPLIEQWVRSGADCTDTVTAHPTKKELEDADWLQMQGSWHFGYPLPDNDFGYLERTYDGASCCRQCGVGRVQRDDFVVKRAPSWGRRGIGQLFWVYDEFFVRDDMLREVFEPAGAASRGVRLKSGAPAQGIRQLVVNSYTDVDTDDLAGSRCGACGATKYQLPALGARFADVRPAGAPRIMKSQQWFGTGAAANRLVFIDRVLYASLEAHGVKGAQFLPVK